MGAESYKAATSFDSHEEITVMDDALVQHPSDDTLKAFGLGKLDGDATRRVDQHLDSCVMCLQKASELVPDKFLDRLKRTIADGGPGVGRPVAAGRQDKGQTAVAGRVGSSALTIQSAPSAWHRRRPSAVRTT